MTKTSPPPKKNQIQSTNISNELKCSIQLPPSLKSFEWAQLIYCIRVTCKQNAIQQKCLAIENSLMGTVPIRRCEFAKSIYSELFFKFSDRIVQTDRLTKKRGNSKPTDKPWYSIIVIPRQNWTDNLLFEERPGFSGDQHFD